MRNNQYEILDGLKMTLNIEQLKEAIGILAEELQQREDLIEQVRQEAER